jgi:hypothetical protein
VVPTRPRVYRPAPATTRTPSSRRRAPPGAGWWHVDPVGEPFRRFGSWRGQSISDILAVEAQITPLESQIAQLQGQQKVLSDEATYGTLSVSVTESSPAAAKPPPSSPPSGLSRAWTHARDSFVHGLESVVSASGGIGVFLVCLLAIFIVGRLGWLVIRRRLV